MLNSLIYASLKHRWIVCIGAVALLVASFLELRRMPIEVFPELNAPTVTIMTEAPGYASEEVERAVTFQIETAINGIPGLRRLRSSSTLGLSIVWAEFDFGVDIYRNRQLIAERLAQIRESLPENIHPPEMTAVASIAGEIMLLGLVSPGEEVSALELRRIAEFELRPRLLAISGVAQITALGGELPQYQVNVRPLDLVRYGVTLEDVLAATRAAHAPVGGGYLPNVEGRELPLRPLTQATSIEDIALTRVGSHRGASVTLEQVADVELGGAPRRGTGSANGEPAVILTVQKNPGVNTLELTKVIDASLDDFAITLPPGISIKRDIFRQADFIDVAVNNVVHALRDGVILVVIILFLFLMNFRTTLITLTAIPLSLGAALLILKGFGATINVMTLGGIAVAIGSVVDDAIVDVENVFRRLKLNARLPVESRRTALEVIYEASVEVRSAIFLATVIIMLVFLPLFFLSGIEGRFFTPLGAAYVVSLAASLVVAMTVTPVLCYFFLRHLSESTEGNAGERDPWVVRHLKRYYQSGLAWAMRRKGLVLSFSGGLLAAAIALGSTFGSAFLPDFNEGSLTLFLNASIGTSLEESDRIARQIEIQTGKIPGVVSVSRRTGRAEQDEHAEPVSASEVDVRLKPGADVQSVKRELAKLFANTPGVTAQIGGPIAHRLSHILSGTPAAVAIKVYGDDLDVLRSLAKEIESAMRPLPGVTDLVANREALITTLPIEFDRRKLLAHGLTPADAAHQLQTAFLGETVGVVNQGSSRIDLVVRLKSEHRNVVNDVHDFLLTAESGALVPVGQVAKIYEESSSMLVARENVKRKAVVSCNVAEGHNLGELIAKIRAVVDPIIQKQPGIFVEYGGQFEAQEEASARIAWLSLLVLVLIFGILFMAFRSIRPVMLVLLNLPLALVGGVIAMFVLDSPSIVANTLGLFGRGEYIAPVVSISSLVGFIGLAGVACRNGLLLISHYYHLMEQEGVPKEQALFQGASERLVPILMTALSSALALIPLVLAKGQIGSELQYPVAVVMLGGLISSTLLNLFVVPISFSLIGGGPRDGNSLDSRKM